MFPRTFMFLIACGVVGWLLGRTRGMGLQGFFLGFAFGPLGWGLVLLWPTSWIQGPVPRQSAGGARPDPGNASAPGPEDPPTGAFRKADAGGPRTCSRCRHPVAPGAGACAHCGNVLLPIHYHVDAP